MNWEQIETKWQAMARRIRADQSYATSPPTKSKSNRTDPPRANDHQGDDTRKSDSGAAA